ncbi:MAG TPA: family 1 glycosylhydrolase, partial [Polyangiaceae bacterium]|nr:family 1 glycosylhydrolase [Polyangiaceae bacterium]
MHPMPLSSLSSFFVFTSSLCLALLPGAVSGCDKTNPDDFHEPVNTVTFPAGFLWGSSTSAFQIETGNDNTDWGNWVALGGKIKGNATPDVGGPDALAHIGDDVAALQNTGQNAYRFSIEWARIYPTRAAFDADARDPAAMAAYDDLVS